MRNLSWIALAAVAVLLPSCVAHSPRSAGSPRGWDPDSPVLPIRERPELPGPRSQVILLADSDGTVGEVEVRSPEGSATLSQARQAVAFDALDRPFEVSAAEIDTAFREALVAEPPPPVEFVVYFPLGSTRLTEASRVVWREVLAVLSERPVPEVSISGHADRVRSEAHNMKLSEARARSIHEKVVAAGIDPEMTDIAWYGETKPASPTADGSPEPLNRRVEVRIR